MNYQAKYSAPIKAELKTRWFYVHLDEALRLVKEFRLSFVRIKENTRAERSGGPESDS